MALEWISALRRLEVVGSGSLEAATKPAVSGAFGVAIVITLLVDRGTLAQLTSLHGIELKMSLRKLSSSYHTALFAQRNFMTD